MEIEINREDEGELISEVRLKELQRSNTVLSQQIRDKDGQTRAIETEKSSLFKKVAELRRETKRLRAEKKDLQDLLEARDAELDQALDQVKMRDDRFSRVKEEQQREMTARVMELKQQKLALEQRLEELEDKVDPFRLGTEASFHDELAQLDDFKPFRVTPKEEARQFTFDESCGPRTLASSHIISTLRSPQNMADTKLTDKLKLEVSEKDYIIKTLKGDLQAFELKLKDLQIESYDKSNRLARLEAERSSTECYYRAMLKDQSLMLTLKCDRLETENIELSSELEKVKVKLMMSCDTWADENNSLRTALNEAETLAFQFKHMYIEAATDCDIYKKRSGELGKERSLMSRIGSLFKKKKGQVVTQL